MKKIFGGFWMLLKPFIPAALLIVITLLFLFEFKIILTPASVTKANSSVASINTSPPVTSLATTSSPDMVQSLSYLSEKAIEASNRTLDIMMWIVTAVVAAFAGIAITAVTSVEKRQKETIRSLEDAKKDTDSLKRELEKSNRQLNELSNVYINVQALYSSLPRKILPVGMALDAAEKGKISMEELQESQAWNAYQKWLFAEDPSGFDELLQYKNSPERLPLSIIGSAIATLAEAEQRIRTPGAANKRDFELLEKIRILLNIES